MAAMNQQLVETFGREVFDRPERDGTPPGPGWANSAERLAGLVRTIEGEVIPRLVLAHRSAGLPPSTLGLPPLLPSASDVAEFATLAVDHDATVLAAHIQKLRARGLSIEAVFLHLLAPCARRLGEMWDDDLCDFTTVTMALWRLQQVLRNLSSAFHDDVNPAGEGHRAILASMPGEQHTFGLFIVAEFFRRAGWEVFDSPVNTSDDLVSVIAHERFAVAGLSLARESKIDEMTALIARMRTASRNRGVRIMVGGPAFVDRPWLVERVGADATASDGRDAAALAQDMLSNPPRRN